MSRCIVCIPARLEATRLPGKPLADIHGRPMIVHVWERAMAAEIGRVVVATDSEQVAAAIRAAGGEAAPPGSLLHFPTPVDEPVNGHNCVYAHEERKQQGQ